VAGRFSAAISAAAIDNRLRVISSPHILASNNKEAKIQIGAEEPILTNTYTGTNSSSDVVTGTIEYKDIGIILTVTPRISDAGMTTLDIQIEDSKVEETTIGSETNLLTVPRFRKKTAKTTMSVAEGQMIVIGGLISESKAVGSSGVPFLSKIPVIGGLFGKQSNINIKTETILLMTPHIISDQTKAKSVTDEFQNKLKTIRKELEERDKKR
jgi:general secretion pathway protein D